MIRIRTAVLGLAGVMTFVAVLTALATAEVPAKGKLVPSGNPAFAA